MKKYFLLFLLCNITTTVSIFGQTSIQEADVPMPEIIYELPQSIIGEFILVSSGSKFSITIFPNNKYIYTFKSDSHNYTNWSCGHIVKIDNRWFTSPLSRPPFKITGVFYFSGNEKPTEIHLTDSGFSFENMQAIRKENMPVPSSLAENISIPRRLAKYQYFEINNSNRVDFNEIITNLNNFVTTYALTIDNGIVRIVSGKLVKELFVYYPPELPELIEEDQDSSDYFFSIDTIFEGFIDLIEENNNGFKGIIRFTNGVPYYYIEDGTAQIEKINDDIIITMLYTPGLQHRRNLPDEYQFPAKLILEF